LGFFPKYGLFTFNKSEETFEHGIVHSGEVERGINEAFAQRAVLRNEPEYGQRVEKQLQNKKDKVH
jgi:hypothetical protein